MFGQSEEMNSRSKFESALDVLKYTTLYGDKGDEMQSINFKFKKLHCTKRLNSLKQKDRTVSFKAI